MQTGLIGLKAEAIGKKKWGIATDRLQKNPNPRTWLLVPAPWVSGSCLLGSCLLGRVNIVLDAVSSLTALVVIYCQLVAILDS